MSLNRTIYVKAKIPEPIKVDANGDPTEAGYYYKNGDGPLMRAVPASDRQSTNPNHPRQFNETPHPCGLSAWKEPS